MPSIFHTKVLRTIWSLSHASQSNITTMYHAPPCLRVAPLFKGVLNWVPIMPRDASLSNSQYKFFLPFFQYVYMYTHILQYMQVTPVVPNLVGGTEPQNIEPFVVGKIKCVTWIVFILSLLLRISYCRTAETHSPNPWGSIEPRIKTTELHSTTLCLVKL